MSIFSNSSHLEWRVELLDTILKGTHPAMLSLIWFSGFRAEDLNVKAYNVRRTDDGRQVMAKAHMAFNDRITYRL
jgi:hypothetical protein